MWFPRILLVLSLGGLVIRGEEDDEFDTSSVFMDAAEALLTDAKMPWNIPNFGANLMDSHTGKQVKLARLRYNYDSPDLCGIQDFVNVSNRSRLGHEEREKKKKNFRSISN